MKTTKRALTAAVLLSCACLMAPYYAHAEETIGRTISATFETETQSTPINISADEGIGILVNAVGDTLNIESEVISSGTNGIAVKIENTTPVERSNSDGVTTRSSIGSLNISF